VHYGFWRPPHPPPPPPPSSLLLLSLQMSGTMGNTPCASPFGGAWTVMSELAAAPQIKFFPGNCTGAGCLYPFPGTRFSPSCLSITTPTGNLAQADNKPGVSAAWNSDPCKGPPGAWQASSKATTVGNAPVAPSPPLPPSVAVLVNQSVSQAVANAMANMAPITVVQKSGVAASPATGALALVRACCCPEECPSVAAALCIYEQALLMLCNDAGARDGGVVFTRVIIIGSSRNKARPTASGGQKVTSRHHQK